MGAQYEPPTKPKRTAMRKNVNVVKVPAEMNHLRSLAHSPPSDYLRGHIRGMPAVRKEMNEAGFDPELATQSDFIEREQQFIFYQVATGPWLRRRLREIIAQVTQEEKCAGMRDIMCPHQESQRADVIEFERWYLHFCAECQELLLDGAKPGLITVGAPPRQSRRKLLL